MFVTTHDNLNHVWRYQASSNVGASVLLGEGHQKEDDRLGGVAQKKTPMSKVEISPVGRWAPNQVQRLRLQPMVNGHWPYMGVDQEVR